ncbi:MAG: cytochrome c-type biogenesis protein CcmH [Gemmatimonadota bacterium]
MRPLTRRELLGGAAMLAVPLAAQQLLGQDVMKVLPKDSIAAADRLAEPWLAGRPQEAITAMDNDPTVLGIERRLHCTCGCTLDIYTCRTTDFTCTYSPALHKEIVAMVLAKQTPEQIVASFVAREGEKMLMAPVPTGFNLAGYLVPGLTVAAVGLALAAWLSRRRGETVLAAAKADEALAMAPAPAPDADSLERLRRALDEVDS